MKLYSYWRSSSAWRVRIALEWKGIPYEYVPVHLLQDGGQQNQESYRAKNPMRTVPLLEVEGKAGPQRISQSMAIIEYLDETKPNPPLLPQDPLARSTARQLAEVINSGIQPFQNLATLQRVKELKLDERAWAQHWIQRGMGALEALLSQTAGTYSLGDQVTLADLYLIPQLYGCRRFGMEVEQFPTALRIERACAALPAFQKAHAEKQPDASAN